MLLRGTILVNSQIPPSPPRRIRSVLCRTVQQGMRYIIKKGWIIKKADKGLGLVLLSKREYNRLVESQISGDLEKMQSFPFSELLQKLREIFSHCHINPTERARHESFAVKHRAPAPFYILPKIHKQVVKARSIMAQRSYILSQLSKDLAAILDAEVSKIPAITINSRQVISELENIRIHDEKKRRDLVLLTYDVEACYPSIGIDDALKVLSQVYPHIFLTRNGFWIRILETIMKQSLIISKREVYRQSSGTAIGTAVAPPFSNLYLFWKLRRVFLRHRKSIVFQGKYIDDGLMLVRGAEQAERICDELEDASNLKFTFDWK